MDDLVEIEGVDLDPRFANSCADRSRGCFRAQARPLASVAQPRGRAFKLAGSPRSFSFLALAARTRRSLSGVYRVVEDKPEQLSPSSRARFPETGWPVASREVMAMLRPVRWSSTRVLEPEKRQPLLASG